MINFMTELLENLELDQAERKLEVDKLKADQLLGALEKLDSQLVEVNKLADDEIALIENYRTAESARLEKQRSYIIWNLDSWMRTTGLKTERLIRGILKLRMGREQISITDPEAFQRAGAKLGLLRKIPESSEPDLNAIRTYLKVHPSLPGVKAAPAEARFSYTLTKGNSNVTERETET